jgi:hypothetical protein
MPKRAETGRPWGRNPVIIRKSMPALAFRPGIDREYLNFTEYFRVTSRLNRSNPGNSIQEKGKNPII